MSLIGAHISAAGGLYRVFERADALNCEALQLFTKSQLRWSAKPLTDEDTAEWKKAASISAVQDIVSHASYLINLAGEPELRKKSTKSMTEEILRCHILGIDKIVLHPGACGKNDIKTALCLLSESLLEILDRTADCGVKILLETMAGQGSAIGSSLEEFARVLEHTKGHSRIAFCADTCHIYAAGYNIAEDEGYENFISCITENIGIERLLCWHLNDSKKTCGSRIDRHEHIGKGAIGLRAFKNIIRDKRFIGIPSLLETPKENDTDKINLEILRSFRTPDATLQEKRC